MHIDQDHLALFDRSMQEAQHLYSVGAFSAATEQYRRAYITSFLVAEPGFIAQGRAARGVACGLDRLGGFTSEVDTWLDTAWRCHYNGLETATSMGDAEQEYQAVRELIQTGNVAGQLLLRRATAYELQHGKQDSRQSGNQAVTFYREARKKLPSVELFGEIDMYRINGVGRAAMSEALYGNQNSATVLALEALRISHKSESPSLPTSADLTLHQRSVAKARAVTRGLSALAVVTLTGIKETPTRRARALKIVHHVA